MKSSLSSVLSGGPSWRRAVRCFSLLLVATTTMPAATIIWTNTAGGTWNTAANWSPNIVPGAGDTANITTPGTYSVALNVNGCRTVPWLTRVSE